ncbi:MAG: CBS domain-containing protein [Candidatus Woesearchaeota archaeon]
MVGNLESVKAIRKKLGWTQHELAKRANVSQSLIAKMESGKLDPAYSKYVQIKEALERATKTIEKKASEIMHSKVISVRPGASLKEVAKIMRKHDVSQLPVIEEGIIVGLVSESEVVENIDRASSLSAGDVMCAPPPQLPLDATLSVIHSVLVHYPIVLVAEKGKIRGLITKSDVLRLAI